MLLFYILVFNCIMVLKKIVFFYDNFRLIDLGSVCVGFFKSRYRKFFWWINILMFNVNEKDRKYM